MHKLWLHISAGFAFLTVMAILALLGREWIQVSPVLLSLVIACVGFGLATMTRRALAPLSAITHVVEGIAQGDLKQRPLTRPGAYEVERLRVATNRMVGRLNAVSAQARELADGKIDVSAVEKTVLRTQRIADADLPSKPGDGDLERSFSELINQRRRLTIQARLIARDQLNSPLLDQKIPGELGEAFENMVVNLRAMAQRAIDISGGDLTSTIDGQGELSDSFNQMVDWLRGLVEQISGTAIHISTAAEQILAVLREQESAANHQAASVDETQRTMETLLSSAKKIAENAQHVFKSAEKTQDNNRTVGERIAELKNHTERITEILENITRIADRSDLLALNASLEGMRAGEAGKGFTLVAAEMRRLAENITGSVSDIKGLVVDIGESSLATALATDQGTRLSENTTDNALKITLITQQQKSGTEQVTQSMDELSALINQDVAGTQQVTMAASELVGLAESLRGLVDKFQVGGSVPVARDSAAAARRARVMRRSAADLGRTATISTRTDSSSNPTPKLGSPRAAARVVAPAEEVAEASLEQSSQVTEIPADSGADQPTIEFSTQLSDDQRHEVMHKMLGSGRLAGVQTVEADLGGLGDIGALGELDELSDFDDLEDSQPRESTLREDSGSIDAELDALERELDKSTQQEAVKKAGAPGGAAQPSEASEQSEES